MNKTATPNENAVGASPRFLTKMPKFILVLWCLGVFRMHADAESFKVVCRAWHPLTWLLLVAMVVPCALMGERLLSVVPLRLTKFWKENRDQLQWVTPFTPLREIKPYRFRVPRSSL